MNIAHTKILKVAFLLDSDRNWMGGVNYQFNLLDAIRQYTPSIEAHLLLPQTSDVTLPDSGRLVKHCISEQHPAMAFGNRALGRVFELDANIEQKLQRLAVDLTFSSNPYLGRFKPALFWIADFQHLHLPEMFSAQQLSTRNRYISGGTRRATLVVLSSEDAANDFRRTYPLHAHKARVMHFVASVSPSIYERDPVADLQKYDLPARFIYLPNQFWRHKNHMIVFEALRHLRSQGITPFIVCTGNQKDLRQPGYFAELEHAVSTWGLNSQIRFLGLVPKSDVQQLIRQSVCVLNPSRFEGWSTTVEEAKSIGKAVLLSDLPVHREQNPRKATFFDPHADEQLAHVIDALWLSAPHGPDQALEAMARQELPVRLQAYADTFVSLAHETVAVAH